MRLVSFLFMLALSAAMLSAQNPAATSVTLDVRVFGADNNAVSDLTKDDFSVYESGQRLEIQTFESVETPFSILLLVERSGSMEDDWVFLEPAIHRFLRALRPQDRVAIAGFVDKPEMLMDWRSAPEGQSVDVDLRPYRREFAWGASSSGPANETTPSRTYYSISSTPPQTDFYGALTWAQQQFSGIPTRKGVVVFGGGIHPLPPQKRSNSGRSIAQIVNSNVDASFQKILRSTEQAEIPLYFVTVGTDLNPRHAFPIDDVVNAMQIRARLQQLAEAAGGNVAYPIKPDDVAPIYEQIARELGTTYSLTVASTRPAGNGSIPRLEVRAGGASLRVRQSIR